MQFPKAFQFLVNNKKLLAFGFFMALTSSFGQSFFIGIIGPEIRVEFSLTQSSWSIIYMLGTIASAIVLPFTGQLIDRIPLKYYTTLVVLLLAISSGFMAVLPSVMFLLLAIFLLRQSGQGLMSHTSFVSMARYFPDSRGKAAAIASLGLSVGQAILPFLMILSVSLIGWRFSYGLISIAIVLVALPISLLLLSGDQFEKKEHISQSSMHELEVGEIKSWSRKQVLRDVRFYILIPGITAPSLVITALFFHNLTIAELKSWDSTWVVANYWVYSVGSLLAALSSGPLIDHLSAKRVLPLFLIPMICSLLIVWGLNNIFWSIFYLFLLGLTAGVTYTGLTALWAELYGVDHLGAIKSLYSSIAIFASALGPVAMGVMLDLGFSMELIALALAGYCIISTGILFQGIFLYKNK